MTGVLHMHCYKKNCFLLQFLLSCSTRHWEQFAGTAFVLKEVKKGIQHCFAGLVEQTQLCYE